jgi:hypothetical protein
MKMFTIIHSSIRHKIGNVISGIFEVIDGVIIIISLGNINSHLHYWWVKCRLFDLPWFYQQQK